MFSWDILSKILNIILGLWTACLYIENRKFKRFEVDKNIKLKELEIGKLKNWYPKEKDKLDREMAKKGITFSGIRKKEQEYLHQEYKNKLRGLEAELEYFRKLKRYKWIFSK